ncbi:MAG TPA: Hint domain-containing protein [Acetobacteraceae bacterium]|nr:Hint domain-containing protein [Acetobacteraceae bacterium]
MTITNTYRWNGKHGPDWNTDIPNPPGKNLTDWDNISDVTADPSFPTGAGDLAVIDLGGAINITAPNGPAGAEELQIVNTSTVTFSSGHFGIGVDGSGGMLIDEDSELVLTSSGTMANSGSLDIIGLTGNGALTLQPGAGFDDLGMIVGADMDAHGVVTVDQAFGFIIAQSGPGSTDGTLVVGEDGAGTVDVSDTSVFGSAFAVLGQNDGSTGEVDLNNSTWSGSALTIGPAGNGIANIGAASVVAFTNVLVGPNGLLNVTGGTNPGLVFGPSLTLAFGTIDVTGGGEVAIGSAAGSMGAVDIAGTDMTALGTIRGNVDLDFGGDVQATGSAPGALLIDGNVHGTGTIEPLMTLEVNGGIDAGVDIAFSPAIGAQVGQLILDVPAANLGTITGFSAGNTIVLEGSLYSAAVFTQGVSGAAGTLTLSGGTLAPLSFAVDGTYAADSFVATPNLTETDITLCFAAGTRIATPNGEVPVERLAAGDEVLTFSGAVRPIVWIGVGKVLATRGKRSAATPVIVRKGALADNVPCRDLRVTKGHSLFVDGVLIPVEELLNHRSILWDDHAQELDIFHIELATHDVLLADGAPAESYRDDGNRWLFRNRNPRWHLPPQAPCVPVLNNGPVVDAAWLRLLDRSARKRLPLTNDADLHLIADGLRVDAVSRDAGRTIFRLPATPRTLQICSQSAIPQELGLARDPRPLGVGLRQIMLSGPLMQPRVVRASDPRLTNGFHAYEAENDIRWTDGDATIPAVLLAPLMGPVVCTLELGAATQYLDEGRTLHAA